MNSPRIVFMGTPDFAVPSADALVRAGMNIVAVVTTPDKPAGRGLFLNESAVKVFAKKNDLPTLTPASLRDEKFFHELKNLAPDVFVVVAFKILPKELLTIPTLGAFNVHASLLPRFRGAAPINWAIIRGERETGVTTFLLEPTIDTGKIILQEKILIGDDDDAGTLHAKLAALGARAALATVEKISRGSVQTITQDDSLATAAPKIFRDDCKINFSQPAEVVRNFIRGLAPYPGAFTSLDGKEIKIFRTTISHEKKISPGEYLAEKNFLYIGTATAALAIAELQLQGKRKMNAEEFLRGWRK